MFEDDNTRQYDVVRSIAGQYSIWPVGSLAPLGWDKVGQSGPKQECLDYIAQVWTDLQVTTAYGRHNQ